MATAAGSGAGATLVAATGVTTATFKFHKLSKVRFEAAGVAVDGFSFNRCVGAGGRSHPSWSLLHVGQKCHDAKTDPVDDELRITSGCTITARRDGKLLYFSKDGGPEHLVYDNCERKVQADEPEPDFLPVWPAVTLYKEGDECELLHSDPPGLAFSRKSCHERLEIVDADPESGIGRVVRVKDAIEGAPPSASPLTAIATAYAPPAPTVSLV